MRQLIYALRFTGHATSVGTAGNVLKAATTAPGTVLTSKVGPDGLLGTLQPVDGTEATFASDITFTSDIAFQETGTIVFGDGHRLQFSTVGSGYLGPSAEPARRHGT